MKAVSLRGGRGNPNTPTSSIDWLGVYESAGQLAIIAGMAVVARMLLLLA